MTFGAPALPISVRNVQKEAEKKFQKSPPSPPCVELDQIFFLDLETKILNILAESKKSWLRIAFLFTDPGLARAWLKTPLKFIHCVTHSIILSLQIFKLHYCQTIRARDLIFWDNIHHPMCVMCCMSYVTYHMSGVRCQMGKHFATYRHICTTLSCFPCN